MSNTNISYKGISEIAEHIRKIGDNNQELGKKFESIINSFKDEKSLSSKIITPSMEDMLKKINSVNKTVKNNCDSYADFLDKDVTNKYSDTDIETSKLYEDLSKYIDSVNK